MDDQVSLARSRHEATNVGPCPFDADSAQDPHHPWGAPFWICREAGPLVCSREHRLLWLSQGDHHPTRWSDLCGTSTPIGHHRPAVSRRPMTRRRVDGPIWRTPLTLLDLRVAIESDSLLTSRRVPTRRTHRKERPGLCGTSRCRYRRVAATPIRGRGRWPTHPRSTNPHRRARSAQRLQPQ